jgi:5-methylcytosine-specific restriction endonuclease McrA
MTNTPPASLSDAALIAETVRAAGVERQSTSQLIALLAELDARKLYLGQGYPSLFAYCTQALHLSEPAAYSRITAARAARRFPMILTLLADGAVTLTTVGLLAAHLTDENHEAWLDAARHRSKRDVERLVATLQPQPDVASSLRRLRPATSAAGIAPPSIVPRPTSEAAPSVSTCTTAPAPASRACVAPLSAERYLLRVTLGAEAYARLARIRDLLRHSISNGDPAAIVDRALTLLLEHLERRKLAVAKRERAKAGPPVTATSRHVPSAVKRVVWARDQGRCAFAGAAGRCRETGFLEFHHVVPFAHGGPTSVENLQLRCRAHNAYEAEREFGVRTRSRPDRTPSGRSSSSGAVSPGNAASS